MGDRKERRDIWGLFRASLIITLDHVSLTLEFFPAHLMFQLVNYLKKNKKNYGNPSCGPITKKTNFQGCTYNRPDSNATWIHDWGQTCRDLNYNLYFCLLDEINIIVVIHYSLK